MKRYISIGLCMLFAFNLSAQKALIIHKTDGTKIEIPVEETPRLYTTGKAVVHDNDYVRNHNVEVDIPHTYPEKPKVTIIDVLNRAVELEAGGICISTSPGVDVEKNDTCILTWEGDFILRTDTMENTFAAEYNTTYYVRSYVKFCGKYYYSEEYCVYVDHPRMSWYGVELYKEGEYIMPTEDAWATFIKEVDFLKGIKDYRNMLLPLWVSYLTPERVKMLKGTCSAVYKCCDGVLYQLDTIVDDFATYILGTYNTEMTMSGTTSWETNFSSTTTALPHIECEEKWEVPGNGYWVYTGSSPGTQPTVGFTLPNLLLAGQKYNIEITIAPDTEEIDTLQSVVRIQMTSMTSTGNTTTKRLNSELIYTEIDKCTIISFDSIAINGFGEASIEVASNMKPIDVKKNKYSRILRIAQIKVTPVGPYKQQEAVAVKEE